MFEVKEKIQQLIDLLENVDLFVGKLLKQKEVEEFILDLNRKDQLFLEGENSLGVKLSNIAGGYSPVTESLNLGVQFTYKGSSKRKLTGQSPFLFDEGIFYKSFTLKYSNGVMTINANPVRDDTNLFDEYGDDILGLQDDNLQLVFNLIEKRLGDEIEKRIAA